jgi:hypothetical protein
MPRQSLGKQKKTQSDDLDIVPRGKEVFKEVLIARMKKFVAVARSVGGR